jgi:hypothetical protein
VAKFNLKLTGVSPAGGSRILNYEDATAYTLSKKMELYTAVVTSTLSDSFYETADGRVQRIRKLVAKCDPVFVAKLAVYTREQMYLRSMPLVLAVELARVHSGDSLVSRLVGRIVQRADEITELLAYYQLANERQGEPNKGNSSQVKKLNKLSKQIKLGLSLAFNKFGEHQFAKYDREGEISLKDALFLVHPKYNAQSQKDIFDKIVRGELATPYTWETELSALGQQKFESPEAKQAAKKAKWEELIDSGKMGYMGILRNLRNILEVKVSKKHIARVAERLSDAKEVANSKQLPFRFLSAYKSLTEGDGRESTSGHESFALGIILEALENAVVASVVNFNGFGIADNVLTACDMSNSMNKPVSDKSVIKMYEISALLGMILQFKCKSVQSGIFGNTWKVLKMPKTQVLKNTVEIANRIGEVGYSTNGWLVPTYLLEHRIEVDKVALFTDCQLWDSMNYDLHGDQQGKERHKFSTEWHKYKELYPGARLYMFDVAGHDNTPVSIVEQGVYLIAGWSDKVFSVLEAIENGSNALTQIESISL